MHERKKKKQKTSEKNDIKVKPGDIKGKIEVTDKRERRDGPGGD